MRRAHHRVSQYARASARMRRVYLRRRIVVGTAALAVVCLIVAVIAHVPVWLGVSGDTVGDTVDAMRGHPTLARRAAAKPRALTSAERALDSIDALDGKADISVEGFTLPADEHTKIDQALAAFTSAGFGASVVMVDMTTDRALSLKGDATRYSASAIKGPYVLSLAATGAIDLDAVESQSDANPAGIGADGKPVSTGGGAGGATGEDENAIAADEALAATGAGVNRLIARTVEVSDNDAFAALHRTYGTDAFAQWATRARTDVNVTAGAYLDMSAADLARLWVMGYGYLFDGDALAVGGSHPSTSDVARQWLAGEFTDTLNSSIRDALGGRDGYTVYTKAGWIDGEGGYHVLNDAGIVRNGSGGGYVIAVMTDAVGRYDLLSALVSTLDGVHESVMVE